MIIEHITTWFSAIVLAQTPTDRWAGARKLNTDSNLPYWFIWSVGIAIAVLVVSFIVVTYKQRSRKAKRAK